MLMLLSVHVTSVLFLVRFNNFALTMGVTCSHFIPLLVPSRCRKGDSVASHILHREEGLPRNAIVEHSCELDNEVMASAKHVV